MKEPGSHEIAFGGNGGWSRTRVRAVALALLVAVGIYLCYRLAQPCIPSLVWAGALAVIFSPLQRWMEARVKRPTVGALLSLLIIGLLVVVPATWFAQKLVEQATTLPQNIQKQIAAGKWHIDDGEHPHLAHLLALARQQVGTPDNVSTATNWGNTILTRLVKESAIAAIQVSLTLYFLFYFLRDRVRVLQAIRWFMPLSESDIDTVFSRVNTTVHATVYGMLALSVLQGLLGGLMFCWLGVPSPWFWALVAAVFAFVPVLDTFVLWLPAAIYLGLEGRWGEALGVAALGSLLVRGIENFLYPVLVRNRLKVPSVAIFIALVGGLLLFGWSGLVLGPVIVTVTSALLEICAKRFTEQAVTLSPGRARTESTESINSEPRCPTGVTDLPLRQGHEHCRGK